MNVASEDPAEGREPMDAFDRYEINAVPQLANAFDDLNLETSEIYDVEGQEDQRTATKLWTVPEIRTANRGASLRRKLLPFTTPGSQLSLGETVLEAGDIWSAEHSLDYIEVRGKSLSVRGGRSQQV